jgi:hypothetical protein
VTATDRLGAYGEVSTGLAVLGDLALGSLVGSATALGTGIGGSSALLEVEGRPVFVKSVPLTELELRAEHRHSTANLFGLPTCYQYGIGSAGFGAWRELAAHVMTTNWVLTGQCAAFPLLYHWRVLPRLPSTDPGLDEMVAFWDGSAAVRERLTALAGAPASLLLFLEYFPRTLHDWLYERLALGAGAIDEAAVFAERSVRDAVADMNARGLLHFDAHYRNLLTDGQAVYVGDLGLAVSPRFDLAPAERSFLAANAGHDRHYVSAHLATWLAVALADPPDRSAFLGRCAAGDVPGSIPPAVAAILTRHAPVALVLNRFYRSLREDRGTPYPRAELDSIVDG